MMGLSVITMNDSFDRAWEVAKSGDFFMGGRPGTKDRMDPKGLRQAVRSGHKWANDPGLKIEGKQAAKRTTFDTRGGSEFSTFVPPPRKNKLWDPSVPWHNENPKHRPWRAINLSEYGRRMPKNRRTGHPEIRSERQELDVIEDMLDRDTHEASHEALELPLRGMPPSVHEYGAIAAQTSGHPRARGIRGLLGLPARDTRRKRFRSELKTHPAIQRRRRR